MYLLKTVEGITKPDGVTAPLSIRFAIETALDPTYEKSRALGESNLTMYDISIGMMSVLVVLP
jgi:hypothetical protein